MSFVEVCCTMIKIGIQWMGKFNEQEKKEWAVREDSPLPVSEYLKGCFATILEDQ